MSRLRLWIVAGTGIAVILIGSAYLLLRDQSWQSTAALTLTPQTAKPADRAALFDSFDRSGTMGTYVELISSRDTLDRAGARNISVHVRAVPDTRVIDVTATGSRDDVRLGLGLVIGAAQHLESSLGDVWGLSVIERPSDPSKSGPSTLLLLLAIPLLAAIAAVAAAVLSRELLPERDEDPTSEEKFRREAVERAQREAEEKKAQRETQERTKRDTQERSKRETQERAKRNRRRRKTTREDVTVGPTSGDGAARRR